MVAQVLKDLLPLDLKENVYIGDLPTDIDNCICITETGGSHGTYFAKDQLNKPFVKITIRNKFYDKGYQQADRLKQILTSYADAETSVVLYGTIQYMGRDDSRRHTFQLTYKVFFK